MTTKTTPFTIALWDSFPADKKPKVITNDNRSVRILCTDRLGDYPIVGLIENRVFESWGPFTNDLFLLIPSEKKFIPYTRETFPRDEWFRTKDSESEWQIVGIGDTGVSIAGDWLMWHEFSQIFEHLDGSPCGTEVEG